MTTIRRFTCNDLFTFNNVNLDILTETYNMPFYLTYLAKWPEYCQVRLLNVLSLLRMHGAIFHVPWHPTYHYKRE